MEDNIKYLDSIDILAILNKKCKDAGGQKAFAEKHGISQSFISDVLNARRDIGPSILRAIGFARVTRYVESRREKR